ncbi:MAG: glycerol-3-phosphate 1-O-acyltransferase PlsY [Candidatus Promineifilaceae bacterium]
MMFLYVILAGLIGYFAGAIPFGFLYVKIVKGIDIREVGSGRTGGTNSLRAAGWTTGVITGLSDVFKGYMAVWISRQLFSSSVPESWLPWVITFAGVMAVIGHNWSIFLGWRGGAGTGPNVGWSTALWWPMFPIGVITMLGLLLTVGMASVASMAMGAIIPIVFAIRYLGGYDPTPAYMVGGFVTLAIVLWALRPNIKRLLAGNERVVGPRAKRMKNKQANAGKTS